MDLIDQERLTYIFNKVFSYGYKYEISTNVIEKYISSSSYVKDLERGFSIPILFRDVNDVLNNIIPNNKAKDEEIEIYVETDWAALMYIELFDKYKITFEALFTYIPLKEMYEMFTLYHEMDITQLFKRFEQIRSQKSIIFLLMKKNKITSKRLSQETGLSISLIDSLKNGRRNIDKVEAKKLYFLANSLHVSIETLFSSIDHGNHEHEVETMEFNEALEMLKNLNK